MSELPQVLAMGRGSFAASESAMGRSSFVDHPAERVMGPPEGARQSSPARLAGDE
jgi:hypothetical protein